MSRRNERAEFYSGIPWVYITPQQARALPTGKLNLVLYLIAFYFVLIGLFKFALILSFGAGLGTALLNGVLPVLTGLGLLARVPWSIIMALVSAILTVWFLIRGTQFSAEDGSVVFQMLETILNVGILFYLTEADRPNLIYRHRYRKYSIEDGNNNASS